MNGFFPEIARPHLPKGVRTRFDDARQTWLLLAPERTLELDQIAATILGEIDGIRNLGQIVDRLAERYEESRDRIADDVQTFLAALAERRMLDIDIP